MLVGTTVRVGVSEVEIKDGKISVSCGFTHMDEQRVKDLIEALTEALGVSPKSNTPEPKEVTV